jgi:hypothetical protein
LFFARAMKQRDAMALRLRHRHRGKDSTSGKYYTKPSQKESSTKKDQRIPE